MQNLFKNVLRAKKIKQYKIAQVCKINIKTAHYKINSRQFSDEQKHRLAELFQCTAFEVDLLLKNDNEIYKQILKLKSK